MTIGILGGGAMGQLIAHLCHQASQPVCILKRPQTSAEMTTYRLENQSESFNISIPTQASDQSCEVDSILVLTKAYQVLDALTPVLTWLPKTVPIFLLHNGIGPQLDAPKSWPEWSWWAGSLTDGALRLANNCIRHTGQGRRIIGPLNHQNNAIPQALNSVGFVLETDIMQTLWQKLTINAVINPLTALNKINNGALLDPKYQTKIDNLCVEISKVSHAEGYKMPWQTIKSNVHSVAKTTSQNRSSMLQDVLAQRRTEVDNITGYVIKRAQANFIDVPEHQNLYNQLRHTGLKK